MLHVSLVGITLSVCHYLLVKNVYFLILQKYDICFVPAIANNSGFYLGYSLWYVYKKSQNIIADKIEDIANVFCIKLSKAIVRMP